MRLEERHSCDRSLSSLSPYYLIERTGAVPTVIDCSLGHYRPFFGLYCLCQSQCKSWKAFPDCFQLWGGGGVVDSVGGNVARPKTVSALAWLWGRGGDKYVVWSRSRQKERRLHDMLLFVCCCV